MIDLHHRTRPRARVCGARLRLADAYLSVLMSLGDALVDTETVTADPRCAVQAHLPTEPHWGMVRRHAADGPPIWAAWVGQSQPHGFTRVETCGSDTYGHGACRLLRIHPGRCSIHLVDPEAAAGLLWRPYRADEGPR
ncbi:MULTISPECIES: hypothetical protein [unclassified Streptomyces]|uniref:hypothetical protein n=1 Tax=unclassified Streptomyces TaxID=2593676 RepID=UPI0038119536